MAGIETIKASSDGFRDEIEITYGLEEEVQLSVRLHGQGKTPVWMTPQETADLIIVLQYALSLMEDADEVS